MKTGIAFAGTYVLIAAYFLSTQGLFGESFIALILGMPWSLIPAFFEFGGLDGSLVYVLLIAPIAINIAVLYWVGSLLERLMLRA